MSTAPSTAAVSTPEGETVAVAGADDCQIARFVISTVVPSLCEAVAKSCRDSPGDSVVDALPAAPTWTDRVVTAGGVGAAGGLDPWQAVALVNSATTKSPR